MLWRAVIRLVSPAAVFGMSRNVAWHPKNGCEGDYYSPQQLGSALTILKSQWITALYSQNTTVKRRNNNNNKKPTLFSDQNIILLQAEVDKDI